MSAMPRGGGMLVPQQQEALRRVRQMQERARQTVEQTNAQTGGGGPSPPPRQNPGAAAANAAMPVFGPDPVPGMQGPGQGPGPGRGRPSQNSGPQNILAQLFGGGQQNRPPHNRSPQGQSPGQAAAPGPNPGGGRQGNTTGGRLSPGGLFDLLKGKGLGDSVSGLGDTLHSTIASVSEPVAKLLDAFDIDGEKLIILLVMWIIFNERGDKTLLLALGYLLL